MLGLRRKTASTEEPPASPAAIHADLAGATVSGQVAIGEHIVQIQAGPGARVTYTAPDARPEIRRRSVPVRRLPRDFPDLLGREADVAAVGAALDARLSIEVSGQPGIGKTALLRHVAHRADRHAPEGVVFAACGGQPVEDVLQFVFESVYESDIVFAPTAAQLAEYLAEPRALVVLDDVRVAREELERILDGAPQCLFVSAATDRLLWGEGRELNLLGLGPTAALELMERELGSRGLTAIGRPAAEAFCRQVGGHPLRILQGAALLRERAATRPPGSVQEVEDELLLALSERDRSVLAPLVALPDAPLDAERVRDATAIPEAADVLRSLEDRGVVQSHSPRYTLAGEAPPITVDTRAWQARMLDTFGVAAEAGALRFPEDADAVLALLEAGARAGRWAGVLRLARGADAAATAGGRVGAWGRLVDHALAAGRALGDPAATAWALHQQGSRALCLGDRVLAADALGQALELRERLGDAEGAATTRHNLAQLGGGAAPPSPNGGPKPPRPRWPWFAGVVAVLAAGIVVAALIAGGGSNESAPAADSTVAPDSGNGPGGAQGSTNNAGATDPNAGSGGGAPGSGGGESPTPGAAGVAPSSLSLGSQPLGQTSDAQIINASNTSSNSAAIGGVSIGGANAGDFAIAGDECGNRTLPANAQCAVAVTFTPTSIGQRTATVDFADVGNGSPAQVVLTGTGCRGETCSGTVDAPPSDGTTTSPQPSEGGTPPAQQAPTAPPAKQKTTAPTLRQPTVGQAPTEVRNG